MNLGLTDKIVFVAGASRGIGLAIAKAFRAEGSVVVITGRDADALEEAQVVLRTQNQQASVYAIGGDMTQPDHIKNALMQTVERFGQIDIVVANVGSGTAQGGWNISVAEWENVLTTNLTGSLSLAGEAMPYLLESRGNLVFISSIVAVEAISAPIPYSAAKAGLQVAMKNLSRLVGNQGVRVNAVTPGNILFPGGSWEKKLQERGQFFDEYIRREVPLQRFGKPEEVADAVLFLASERANFITGSCLVIDGGQTRSL